MIANGVHICEIPIRARNGAIWRCEECNQSWRRVSGIWKLTLAEVQS